MLQSKDNKKKEINHVLDQEVKERRKSTRKTNIQEGKENILKANNVTKRSINIDQDLTSIGTVQDQKIRNRESRRSISRESIDTDSKVDSD